MSKTGERIMEGLNELADFAAGRNTEPLILHMPDGNGNLVKHEVKDMSEYHALWSAEGVRVIIQASDKPEKTATS